MSHELDSSEHFAVFIKKTAKQDNMSLIDTIVSYCEESETMDMESAIALLDSSMKAHLKQDAINNRKVLGFKLANALF